MKVALIHDWLTGMRGGERCLMAFLELYPEADIYTLVHTPGATNARIDSRVCETSFLNKIPGIKRFYRLCLPLYPLAVRFDLRGYDLVISLSHAAAKNISVPKDTVHLSYCFTPMRYIWDQRSEYFGSVTPFLEPVLGALRRWDRLGSDRVTRFVAISRFIAARIRCFYGRDADVIYPPVDCRWIEPAKQGSVGEAFLYAGALVPYKRADLVVDACSHLGEPLWVVGNGPELAKLRMRAGPTIKFIPHATDTELGEYYRRAKALIFPGTEDFGMVPVECMAAGRPVIGTLSGALRETVRGVRSWHSAGQGEPRGGALEVEGASGVFISPFGDRDQALRDAISYFRTVEGRFSVEQCREQAQKFSPHRFFQEWKDVSARELKAHREGQSVVTPTNGRAVGS